MIITLAGKAGTGKTTVAKMLAAKYSLHHYSMGDLQRKFAAERGMTLAELGALEEKDPTIDKQVDAYQVKLAEQEDDFVIDSRLGAIFIKNATLRVFLDGAIAVRAKRILYDPAARTEEERNDLDQMIASITAREASEQQRYQTYYGIDYFDQKHYDIVIDTSSISAEQVYEKIVERFSASVTCSEESQQQK